MLVGGMFNILITHTKEQVRSGKGVTKLLLLIVKCTY